MAARTAEHVARDIAADWHLGHHQRMALALDTLEYARRLREAGCSEQLAEGHAQALAAVMTESLASKQDLRELALANRQDFREFSLLNQHDLRETAAALQHLIRETAGELRRELGETAAELRREFSETAADLRREFAETAAELRREFAETAAELRREFGETTSGLRREIRALERHVDERFASVEARLGRLETRLDGLERHIDLRFAEARSGVAGQLADLERRMTLRLGGLMVAGIATVSALVKLL